MKGQLCQAQLNQMKQFVNNSKDNMAKLLLSKASHGGGKVGRRFSSRAGSVAGDNSEDEDFIQSKRMSLSDLVSADDVTCSPTLKSQTIKLPAYHQHRPECQCQSCVDLMLHQYDIEYFAAQARSSLMQGELIEASTEVDTVTRFANAIKTRDDKLVQNMAKLLSDDSVDKTKENEKPKKNAKPAASQKPSGVTHTHERKLLELKLLKIQIMLQQNKSMKAQQGIDEALRMFTDDVSPVILPGHLKAELQYYQVVTNMCRLGCDAYTTAWKQLQSHSVDSMLSSQLEDLSSKLSELDLMNTVVKTGKGVCRRAGGDDSKPSMAWQASNDSGVARPELSRKDLVTPSFAMQSFTSGGIGIFCDPSNNDEDVVGGNARLEGACDGAIAETPKPAGARHKSNLQMSTKKGILSYSVKKKQSQKSQSVRLMEDRNTSQIPMSGFTLENDVFGFDSPSLASKKGKSARKTKSATTASKNGKTRQKSQRSKVTFVDSDMESQCKTKADQSIDDNGVDTSAKSSKTLVFSLDNDTDLEQETASCSKPKSKRKASNRVVADIDYEEKHLDEDSDTPVVGKRPPRKSNARTGTARKKPATGKTAKRPAFVLSESETDPDDQPKASNRRTKKSESDDSQTVAKPKGKAGKKLPAQQQEDEGDEIEEMVTKKTITRPRRGRRANIETARAYDTIEEEVESFDILLAESCVLPLDDVSPSAHNLSNMSYSDLDLSCGRDQDVSISDTASSSVDITIRSAVCDMLILEDVDEIEIPRAGPDSDGEDTTGRDGARKKKVTTAKKLTGRRRPAKKIFDVEDEGVEMLRASTQGTEELSNRRRGGKNTSGKQQDGTGNGK